MAAVTTTTTTTTTTSSHNVSQQDLGDGPANPASPRSSVTNAGGRRERSHSLHAAFRVSRIQEKNHLAQLNDRLAAYIDHVRHLESEYSKLTKRVKTSQETHTREVVSLKISYDHQLDKARHSVDFTASEKAKRQTSAESQEVPNKGRNTASQRSMPAINEMGGGAKLGGASFRVAEFSDVLDWRPMLFQEPVIAQRACALCGVVFKTAVKLPCAHTLCTKCHTQCVDKGGACPVDQEPFCEKDLEKLEISAEYILNRKVACWNAPSGCSFIGTTASLLDHYKECGFSVVPCCLCLSSVLQCDILEHFQSGCITHEVKCVPSNSPATEELKDISAAYLEMKRATGRISQDLMSLQTNLNRCSEDITLEEAKCRVQRKAEASTLHDEIKRLAEQLKDSSTICTTQVPEAMQVALQAVMADYKEHVSKELRLLSLSKPTRVHWYIEGWELRKRDAVYKRLCSPTSNMYGYNVSQEVTLKQKDEEVSLGCFMVIHPGDHDLQLEWPFRKVYTLGVIHPKDPSNVISCQINAVNCGDNLEHCFLRPKGRKANVGYGNGNLTTVWKLETNGFIQSDTLHIFLEIEP